MDRESRHKYYWILAEDETGKPFLIKGSDRSEEDARSKAFEMLSGLDFEIRALPTRNLARASALIRGVRLEETHSLRRARGRIGHERSLDRLRKRIQRRQY